MLSILQFEWPEKASWTPDDRHFLDANGKPLDPSLEAFCDFEHGREMFLREWVFCSVVNGRECNPQIFDKGSESLGHEFGHIFLSDHKSRIAARNRGTSGGTSKRAAHNRKADRSKTWLKANRENADLEEEADMFGYALHVAIQELRDEPSLQDIETKFNVNRHMAYQSALLARDYFRAEVVLKG